MSQCGILPFNPQSDYNLELNFIRNCHYCRRCPCQRRFRHLQCLQRRQLHFPRHRRGRNGTGKLYSQLLARENGVFFIQVEPEQLQGLKTRLQSSYISYLPPKVQLRLQLPTLLSLMLTRIRIRIRIRKHKHPSSPNSRSKI